MGWIVSLTEPGPFHKSVIQQIAVAGYRATLISKGAIQDNHSLGLTAGIRIGVEEKAPPGDPGCRAGSYVAEVGGRRMEPGEGYL